MQVRYSQDGVKILFRLGLVVPLLIWAVPLLVWSARLTSDYKAISVQLQLQLPTGTELGNSTVYFMVI